LSLSYSPRGGGRPAQEIGQWQVLRSRLQGWKCDLLPRTRVKDSRFIKGSRARTKYLNRVKGVKDLLFAIPPGVAKIPRHNQGSVRNEIWSTKIQFVSGLDGTERVDIAVAIGQVRTGLEPIDIQSN